MITAEKKFRGFQLYMDEMRLREHLLPGGVINEDMFSSKPVDYFRKYGFKVARKYSELYERYNGIASEKYIPASLYYYTIYPFLCNLNFSMAYADKNAYDLIFHSFKRPETYLHSINNRYLLPQTMEEISETDAIDLLSTKAGFIIKPAIESGGGRDVFLVKGEDINRDKISELFKSYETNFIVQEILSSHPDMLRLNKSSLNTIRVYTFRVPDSMEYAVLGSAVRFGGEGAFRDNACTGGGFARINREGIVEDRIYRYCSFEKHSLKKEKQLANFRIPSFHEVIEMCINMHKLLPYMDLVGWDIAIDGQADPVFIELNQTPDCEFIQICNGPMFGEYTDAVMERVQGAVVEEKLCYARIFHNGPKQYDYKFDISRKLSI